MVDQPGWHPQEARHRAIEQQHWRAQNRVAARTLWFSIFAVLASAASAYFAYFALSASHRAADAAIDQANISRDSEHRQLRAYVYTTVTNPLPNLSPGVQNSFSVDIINGGLTPAYNALARLRTKFIPLPFTKIEDQNQDQPADRLDFSHSSGDYLFREHTYHTYGRPVTLDPAQATAVGKREAIVVFWGDILYKDVFGCSHHTNFCAKYTPDGVYGCPEHNDLDSVDGCRKD
jgi:hypothetical protein